MFPVPENQKIADSSSPNTIFFCQTTMSMPTFLVFGSNLSNLFGSNFRFAIKVITAFFNSILNIIFISPKKKMLRIDASPIITGVANQQPFWNWSFKKLIRNSVCRLNFSFKQKSAIARIMQFSSPYQAFIYFFSVTEETLFHKAPLPQISCAWGGYSNRSF